MVIIRKHGISAFRVLRLMVYVVGRGHVVTRLVTPLHTDQLQPTVAYSRY